MCGGSAPEAPDLTPIAKAMEKQSDVALKLGERQQAWAEEMWGEQWSRLQPILQTQGDIMAWNWDNAVKDRRRYEQQYQPIEDALIRDFESYASPQRIEREAGRAQAQYQQVADAQRRNMQQRLEGYGIDPSQTRSQALDRDARVQEAAQVAAAGNTARERTEAMGRVLRGEAINIGRGMPSQALAASGQSLQAGPAANANIGSAIGTGASTMGTGQSWMQQGMSGLAGAANVHSQGYQNQLAGYSTQSGTQQMAGQLIGAGMGAAAMMANKGGAIPEGAGVTQGVPGRPKDYDDVPAVLTEGEYVIPADVVRAKGTEFFDKLINKTQGIPA